MALNKNHLDVCPCHLFLELTEDTLLDMGPVLGLSIQVNMPLSFKQVASGCMGTDSQEKLQTSSILRPCELTDMDPQMP